MTGEQVKRVTVVEAKRDLYMEFMVSHNRGAGCVDFDDRVEEFEAAVREDERERAKAAREVLVDALLEAHDRAESLAISVTSALRNADQEIQP